LDDPFVPAGWERVSLPAGPFVLTALVRLTQPGAPLQLYIEGDGAAWIDGVWPPADPTPKRPLALELADRDPAANKAYLARPGQYPARGAPPCDPAYWSDRRFAPEVATAMDRAVTALAARAGTREIHLIGYSGGAALAVLVAAGRGDVASLRTVAGNLAPAAVNRHHGVSPLAADSLDPLAAAPRIRGIPQRHFAGAADQVIPLAVGQTFAERLGPPFAAALTVVEGATHGEGWRDRWRALLALPLATP
jgi:pimeloyl-ACP methyl ester carboxylesterase